MRRPCRQSFALVLLFSSALTSSALTGCKDKPTQGENRAPRTPLKSAAKGPASYVGRQICADCHAEAVKAYVGSLHDDSTQVPTAESVRAPFDGEAVTGKFVSATFEGGKAAPLIKSSKDYPVKWTIGREPLQQFVVESERGHMQVFPAAFDTRGRWEGGEANWFLLAGTDVAGTEPAHFLKSDANWNSACASCHSTNVEKNYNEKTDTYDTRFSEIDVSCEACHGPAGRHVETAKSQKDGASWPVQVDNFGFDRVLTKRENRRWFRKSDEATARLSSLTDGPPERTDEIGACGPCHSNRLDTGPLPQGASPAYDDRYLIRFLEDDLYFKNGQWKGDNYVLGSYLQSSKFSDGVVCSDCHDPHSTTLRKPVEELCVTCHSPEKYDSESHHFHAGTSDAFPQCVDCHMPKRTLMQVDVRREHRFSVPRPDLSETTGDPYACQACHSEKSASWATLAIEKVHGAPKTVPAGLAIHAASVALPGAPLLLSELVSDKTKTPLVRASALSRWSELDELALGDRFKEAVLSAATSKHAYLRRAAATAGARLPDDQRIRALGPLLTDELRTVRITAALHLAAVALSDPKLKAAHDRAFEEALGAALYNIESFEGLMLLADLNAQKGSLKEAQKSYEKVISRYPARPEPFLHLLRALLARGEKSQAEALAERALLVHTAEAEFLHVLGMARLETKDLSAALPYLKGAFENAPNRHRRRYGYSYAITVNETGDWAEALALLRLLEGQFPGAEEIPKATLMIKEKRGRK